MKNYLRDLRRYIKRPRPQDVSLETFEYWELLCNLVDYEDKMSSDLLVINIMNEIKTIVDMLDITSVKIL